MDETFIAAVLGNQDVYKSALVDGLARAREYFATHDYTDEAAEQWAEGLLETAPHLFANDEEEEAPTAPGPTAQPWLRHGVPTEERWNQIPPAQRRTWDREWRTRTQQQQAPVQKRQEQRALTPEEAASCNLITDPRARRTEARRLREQGPR
jgi:hypothetical protein